jgi:diguanylate cyclase (GGDEF)-like protein
MATLLDDEELSSKSLARKDPRPRNRAVLIQMTGLEAGRVCSIDGTSSTFGRAPDCAHRFDEASLSRVHARVVHEGDSYVVEDAGSRNGVFVNEHRVTRALLTDGDRLRLGSAVVLRFQLVDDNEEHALKKVYDSSVKDGLTGAANRKYLEERLVAEVAFAVRHSAPLALVILDIDFFKKVNDTYGHAGGDEILRETAALLRKTLRTEDLLARFGGEEFVVLARGVDLRNATHLAERLRAVIERSPVAFAGRSVSRTISLGVASLECCGTDRTPQRILAIADERLYRAKESGRNRVVAS